MTSGRALVRPAVLVTCPARARYAAGWRVPAAALSAEELDGGTHLAPTVHPVRR